MSNVAEPDCAAPRSAATPAEAGDLPWFWSHASLGLRLWAPISVLSGLALLGVLLFDVPLARMAVGSHPPGLLQEMFDIAEPFGSGLGVAVIGLMVFQLDRARRWAVPRILIFGLGSGLAANCFKLLLARARPRSFDFELGGAWHSFGAWFPLGSGGSGQQSFPSAHTASCVGLAVALSTVYPQGRWLFFGLALLVPLERVGGAAHFFSDICIGALVGWMFAAAWLRFRPMARSLGRLEQRLVTGSPPAPIAQPTPMKQPASSLQPSERSLAKHVSRAA